MMRGSCFVLRGLEWSSSACFRDPDRHRVEVFTNHYEVTDMENEPPLGSLLQGEPPLWTAAAGTLVSGCAPLQG